MIEALVDFATGFADLFLASFVLSCIAYLYECGARSLFNDPISDFITFMPRGVLLSSDTIVVCASLCWIPSVIADWEKEKEKILKVGIGVFLLCILNWKILS